MNVPPAVAVAPRRLPFKTGWSKEEHIRFLNGLQIHGKGMLLCTARYSHSWGRRLEGDFSDRWDALRNASAKSCPKVLHAAEAREAEQALDSRHLGRGLARPRTLPFIVILLSRPVRRNA